MKKDVISNSINKISDEYIEEAIDELYKNPLDNAPKEVVNMKRKNFYRIAVAMAACLILGVGTIACAKILFNVNHREAKPNEIFSIEYFDQVTGEMETNVWEDAKYVMTFDGPDECNAVEFKEHWLPAAPNESRNAFQTNSEGWRTGLTSEFSEGDDDDESMLEYFIEVYYAPQFKNDGAMLILYCTPEEITEDHRSNFDIIKIRGTRDGYKGIEDSNFYIMLNESAGYVIVLSGSSEIETLEHIANELEIRETSNVINSKYYSNHVVFLDPGRG